MNKFGPHWQRLTDEMKTLIGEWQPPMGTWVDPNPEGLAKVRNAAPSMFVIGRKNEEGTWDSPNLKDRAYFWADRCAEMGRCDAYYCWNEPLWHGDLAKFSRFDDFQCWFLERMRSQHGMEAVAFNFGTGNFTKDGPDVRASFPNSCDQFRHFGIHEYDWIIDPIKRPVTSDRLGYYWHRWPYWLDSIGRNDVTLWITECGMTQAVHEGRPDEGWRSGADGMTDDDYITWASWYNGELVREKRIGGAALFNFAGYGWETFEHLGWDRLGEILALDEQPPQEENGGETMFPRVFNIEGEELFGETAEDLVRYHGLTLTYPALKDGDKFLDLVKLEEREGPACFIFTVLREDGWPWVGVETAWGWTGMGEESNDIETPYATDWHEWADIGLANENGNNGPGFGQTGWYHGPYEPGPGRAWVRHAQYWAVLLEGIGMEGGTNHRTMYGTWQLKTYSGEQPQPPPQGDLAAEVNEMGVRLQEISALMGNGGNITRIVAYDDSGGATIFVRETGGGLIARVKALVGR